MNCHCRPSKSTYLASTTLPDTSSSVPAISVSHSSNCRVLLRDLQNAVIHQPLEQLGRQLVADAELYGR